MYLIDSSGAASSLPAPAAPGTPGYFTGGNPATATPATILDADWFNAVMLELVNVVTAAGITLAKGTNNQVITALDALFAAVAGNSTQTFKVAAATLPSQAVNLGQFPVVGSGNNFGLGQPNGWILQVFQVALPNSGTSTSTVSATFAEPFPTGCIGVFANALGAANSSTGYTPSIRPGGYSKTGCTITGDTNAPGVGLFNQNVSVQGFALGF